MPQPKKTVRTIFKNIGIAEDLVAQVELEMYSDLQKRVPFGAWQKYIDRLIRQDLATRKAATTSLEVPATPGAAG